MNIFFVFDTLLYMDQLSFIYTNTTYTIIHLWVISVPNLYYSFSFMNAILKYFVSHPLYFSLISRSGNVIMCFVCLPSLLFTCPIMFIICIIFWESFVSLLFHGSLHPSRIVYNLYICFTLIIVLISTTLCTLTTDRICS